MGVNYEVNWFWNSGAKPQNNNLFKSFKNFIYATRGCVRGERSSSYICFLCACAILRWISEKCPSFQINDIMGVAVCTSHESRRAIWYNPSQHSKAIFHKKGFVRVTSHHVSHFITSSSSSRYRPSFSSHMNECFDLGQTLILMANMTCWQPSVLHTITDANVPNVSRCKPWRDPGAASWHRDWSRRWQVKF